jgi:hypothetical protein
MAHEGVVYIKCKIAEVKDFSVEILSTLCCISVYECSKCQQYSIQNFS